MDTKRIIACVLAASLLAPVIGLAQDSDADRSHPAQFVKDSAITAAIKTKLAADHPASLGRLKVDTDKDGVVWTSNSPPASSGGARDCLSRVPRLADRRP